MKCKKCSSDDLVDVNSGPHSKVICGECWTFQKFNEDGKPEMKLLEEIYFKLDLILDHLGIMV